MKQRVNGFEAVGNGLMQAGITRVMISLREWDSRMSDILGQQKTHKTSIETLKRTEEAIDSASFFSQKGENAACLIREDAVYKLAPLLEEYSVSGTLIFIIIGEEKYKYMKIISLYGVDYSIAYDLKMIPEMLCNAAEYSRLAGKPAVLYVSQRMLISSMWVDVKSIYGRGAAGGRLSMRSQRAEKIIAKYEHTCADERLVIAVPGDLTDLALNKIHKTNRTDTIVVWNMDLLRSSKMYSLPLRRRRTLVIEKGRSLMHVPVDGEKGRRVVIKNSFSSFEEEIEKAIDGFIRDYPDVCRSTDEVIYDEDGNTALRVRISESGYGYGDETMCPGCIYRRYVAEALASGRYSSYSEDFFCSRRMAHVVTGISNPDVRLVNHPAVSEVVFTNRENAEYAGAAEVSYMEAKCLRDGNIAHEKSVCRIVTERCDGCGKCSRLTGCPAIWRKGLRMFIDEKACTGCGLCAEKCEGRAIEYVGKGE